MSIRLLAVIFLSGLFAACARSPDDHGEQPAHFGDQKAASAPASQSTEGAPPPPSSNQTTAQEQAAPAPSKPVEASKPVAPASPLPQVEEPTPSPLITNGYFKTDLPEYHIPDRLRERIAKFQPEILPPASSPDFEVADHHLNIDVKKKTVTFSGVLKVKGKTDEKFELSCQIDTAQVPWLCRDMMPTDRKLALQKRFQGTFKCLDTYICDNVGVALWVVIDGKLQDPKLFQAHGFRVRRASSGDDDDDGTMEPSAPPADLTKLPPKIQDRLPQEPDAKNEKAPPGKVSEAVPPLPLPLPRPRPAPPVAQPRPQAPAAQVQQAPSPDVSEDEAEQLFDDPDASIEISEPMTMPTPSVGKFSVPGIEKLHAAIGEGGKVQAVGWHNSGYLQKAAEFPQSGAGYISRDHGSKDFGTDLTVSLISIALAQMNQKYPGRPPVVLGQVANRTGGKLFNLAGRAHASHQTGLDADVGLPSTRPENGFYSACGASGCSRGHSVTDRFDVERFWLFIKQVSCADNKPVIAMFLDRTIKKFVCDYVRNTAHENMSDQCVVRALQALRHEAGHDNHVHVRLRCPENSACQNSWVTLANGTGC